MSKESILARVGVDVAGGDLGKARDRLHTLVFEHPDDLSLRERLAEVYDSLQQPAQAGRYWYLIEPRDDRMVDARAAYERLVGNDPLLLLAGLKFRGDEDALAGFARQTVGELRDRLLAVYGERLPRSVRVRSRRDRQGAAHLYRRPGWHRYLPGEFRYAADHAAVRWDVGNVLVLAALGTLVFQLVKALRSKSESESVEARRS